MKPGPAISVFLTSGSLPQLSCDLLGQVARLHAGVLGQRHGGVGCKIAVARLARRLDDDARQIEARRNRAGLGQRFDGGADVVGEDLEHVHAARVIANRCVGGEAEAGKRSASLARQWRAL